MPLDVESKATLDEVVDRLQAAIQQVLSTAKQDLNEVGTAKIAELEAAASRMMAGAVADLSPVLAESQAIRAELGAWRKLIAGGFSFGAKS